MKDIKEYIDEVEKLQHNTFVHAHQCIIDTIEQAWSELICWEKDKYIPLDELLGAMSYNIETLIEVVNPEFKKDIEILNKLLNILNNENTVS